LGNDEHHARIAREKRSGALDEFSKKRYTNVADLALKAVEQAIEAAASKENLHFHKDPRSAHYKRSMWLKKNFPQVASYIDILWGIYGLLGYNGINGERAKKAIEAMERILDEIQRKTGIRLK